MRCGEARRAAAQHRRSAGTAGCSCVASACSRFAVMARTYGPPKRVAFPTTRPDPRPPARSAQPCRAFRTLTPRAVIGRHAAVPPLPYPTHPPCTDAGTGRYCDPQHADRLGDYEFRRLLQVCVWGGGAVAAGGCLWAHSQCCRLCCCQTAAGGCERPHIDACATPARPHHLHRPQLLPRPHPSFASALFANSSHHPRRTPAPPASLPPSAPWPSSCTTLASAATCASGTGCAGGRRPSPRSEECSLLGSHHGGREGGRGWVAGVCASLGGGSKSCGICAVQCTHGFGHIVRYRGVCVADTREAAFMDLCFFLGGAVHHQYACIRTDSRCVVRP